ncbi:MAG TPA: hypothetical protein VFV47_04165 [Hyphomicrobiaceae bacterium]|nr:hypothetical protein [Hyphomicrobiaceae bacterium]
MITYRQVPVTGLSQTAGLLALKHSHALERFRKALQSYEETAGTARQAYAIEGVIRTSPGIAENRSSIDEDDMRPLLAIRERYRAYAGRAVSLELTCYADAYAMLRAVFF